MNCSSESAGRVRCVCAPGAAGRTRKNLATMVEVTPNLCCGGERGMRENLRPHFLSHCNVSGLSVINSFGRRRHRVRIGCDVGIGVDARRIPVAHCS